MKFLHELFYVIIFCLMPCVVRAENSGIFIVVLDEDKAPVQSNLKGPSDLEVAGTTDINGIYA